MSRSEIPIDWDIVDQLLLCGCPGTEVAAHFGMHPETLYNKVEKKFNTSFSAYSAQKKANGEALLRKAQFEKALGLSKKGDNTLLIWLGKQRLAQRETPIDLEVSKDTNDRYLQVIEQLTQLQTESRTGSGLDKSSSL